MTSLVYQTNPVVDFATNTFHNTPVILQFDDTPLLSIVKEENLSFTTEIPIFHSDGTYLAKVRGTRVYSTSDGDKAGINLRSLPAATVCELNGKTLFEIDHATGDSFRFQAELHTPNGYFLKYTDQPTPDLISNTGQGLQVGGVMMQGNMFSGCSIGVWVKSDGSVAIGVG